MKCRTILVKASQALGIASIPLLANISWMSSSGARMCASVPLTRLVWANIFDLIIAAVLAGSLFALSSRTRFWPICRLIAAAVLPACLLYRSPSLTHHDVSTSVVVAIALFWSGFLCVLYFHVPLTYRRVLRVGNAALAGFGVFALLICGEMLRNAAWTPGPQEIASRSAGRQVLASLRSRPFILWIIFDELSYDQVFEHRATELQLPEFDRLRAQSTLYTQVTPLAYYTTMVIPSVILGDAIIDVDFTFANQLRVRTQDNQSWHAYEVRQTIFAHAHDLGWTTAAVGWYYPYCPVLKSIIDWCYWEGYDNVPGPIAADVRLTENTLFPLRVLLEKGLLSGRGEMDKVSFQVDAHMRSYKKLYSHSVRLLKDGNADFVILHLPIPHPPGIYDRRSKVLVHLSGHSYLDNLALADRTLGELIAIAKASPRWPNTSVVVMGDHSWRLGIWQHSDGWTEEDAVASRGVFDPRPLLLVHTAGQSSPQTVEQILPLIEVHTLVTDMLGNMSQDDRRQLPQHARVLLPGRDANSTVIR